MLNEDYILNPTIFLGNFEFREPVTTLTDFMVAIIAAFGFLYLSKHKSRATNSYHFYRNYFLFFAVGMTSAAWLGHGLQAYVGYEWKMIGWLCSLTAQFFLALASLRQVQSFLHPTSFKVINIASIALYCIFIGLILIPQTRSFKVAQMGNAIILVGVTMPLQLLSYFKLKNAGSLYILLAILFGGITAILYNNQFSISRWYNYHDISHTMVSITMIIMTFAIRKLALQEDMIDNQNKEFLR